MSLLVESENVGIDEPSREDLCENWLEAWAESGVRAIEDYLAKHLAFLSFLEDD